MARRSRQCQFSVELVLQRANSTQGSSGSEARGPAGSTPVGGGAGLGGQVRWLLDARESPGCVACFGHNIMWPCFSILQCCARSHVCLGAVQGTASEDLVVNGTISSPNCGVVLGLNATTTHIEVYYSKAVNYTVMITVLAFVQVRA